MASSRTIILITISTLMLCFGLLLLMTPLSRPANLVNAESRPHHQLPPQQLSKAQQGPRIGIITLATPDKKHTLRSALHYFIYTFCGGVTRILSHCFSLHNKKRYADSWHYVFLPVFTVHDETLPPEFEKIVSAMQYFKQLPSLEWLWLLDMDAYIMNKWLSIEDQILSRIPPLKSDTVSLILNRDANGTNAGSYLIRNTPFSAWLLQTMWDLRYNSSVENYHALHDQAVMVHVLKSIESNRSDSRGDAIMYVPQRVMNSYMVGDNESKYQVGDFLIHFAGVGHKLRALDNVLDTYKEPLKDLLP
eukprot:gene6829-30802_t